MERKRILIADDEKGVRIALACVLNNLDFEIDFVENGLDAVLKIEKKSYDLIITDIMMPVMDGFELIEKVRIKKPWIPILVITGNYISEDLKKGGAITYINKPFSVVELRKTVKKILNDDHYNSK